MKDVESCTMNNEVKWYLRSAEMGFPKAICFDPLHGHPTVTVPFDFLSSDPVSAFGSVMIAI